MNASIKDVSTGGIRVYVRNNVPLCPGYIFNFCAIDSLGNKYKTTGKVRWVRTETGIHEYSSDGGIVHKKAPKGLIETFGNAIIGYSMAAGMQFDAPQKKLMNAGDLVEIRLDVTSIN